MEIPPRVRRRVTDTARPFAGGGNTSACAEKRGNFRANIRGTWKYLRVCGEESWRKYPSSPCTEIPPHVRRRVFRQPKVSGEPGNTSACAEKRLFFLKELVFLWKYLRVCGEELLDNIELAFKWEIPPRVRRRGGQRTYRDLYRGNTSACAEKSGHVIRADSLEWKYLRVCGEEAPCSTNA